MSKDTKLAKAEAPGATTPTVSQKFTQKVERQYAAEAGSLVPWQGLQRALAQHLYLKIDASLKALQEKGTDVNWGNLNMDKLALDAVHRVSLGLDALIPNHIHPIPYRNSKTGKYDLDLRIGYVGMDFCRRSMAVEPVLDITYHLVHAGDTFEPVMKDMDNPVESFRFKMGSPFDRGEVVGGFGYISYANPTLNRLVIVTQRDFDRAEAAAKSGDFWGKSKSRQEMQYKTIVHRTTSKIALDPAKVNAGAWAKIEAEALDVTLALANEDAALHANGEVLALDAPVIEAPAKGKAAKAGAAAVDESVADAEPYDPYGQDEAPAQSEAGF